MNITVWSNFSKRINSTKQPAANTGTIKTVLLKDATDIEAPVFELNTVDFSINYVQAFGHYYFCDVRNLDGSRSEIVCTMDHLATYKDQIKAYSGLVEYTSSSSNVLITDPRNKPTMEIESISSYVSTGLDLSITGAYILGVVSKNASSPLGSTAFYYVSPGNMQALCAAAFDHNFLDNLRNEFTNPMDSIISCIWLPFANFGTSGCCGTPENIYLGSYDTGVLGAPIINRNLSKTGISVPITFPTTGKTYLQKSPYSTGTMYLPFVGSVPLDVDMVADSKALAFDIYVDVLTGDMMYRGMVSDGLADKMINTYSGNCATKVPISAYSYDAAGVVGGALAIAGGIAGAAFGPGGAAAGATLAAGVVGGAATMIKSTEVHTMINGSVSSAVAANLGSQIIVTVITNKPVETNLTAYKTKHGMPYFKVATLSSLSGYIQCADASVEIPGTAAEKTAVNGYLNSGFYLE